jgi:hypothetical protein
VNDTVVVAVLGIAGIIITGLVGPQVLARQAAKVRAAEKKEDWARQDEVAARVIAAAAAAEAKADAVAERLVENDTKVTGKLDGLAESQEIITTLVDGSYTRAMQSELDAKEALLVVLKREIARDKRDGLPVDEDAVTRVKELKASIVEARKALDARLAAVKVAEKQAESHGRR